tara:strand:- start:55 stop:321 length:267 start_codon:yes stop_codon:yes gene_type:complete
MIEYILGATKDCWVTENAINNKKKSARYERLHIKIDEQLTVCPSCKRVWRKNRKMMTREWEYFPKNHIPTIGKKRETCPKCKENNNNG